MMKGFELDPAFAIADEQALRGEPSMIADATVGIDARLPQIVDVQNHASARTTDRRLRWLSMTC